MFSTFAKKSWLAISVSTFVLGLANAQEQEKVLRIAMTAADIPRTLGQPTRDLKAIGSPASQCMTRSPTGICQKPMQRVF